MNVVVFGGTGGIGKQLIPLIQQNHDVISLGSNDVDVRSKESVDLFFENNDVDVVINLAAKNIDSFIHKCDTDSVLAQLDVNVLGNLNILRSCLPYFRKKKFGRIILASSILASNPEFGTSVYAASKSFCESLVRSCALENSSLGITCNAIQLGYFDAGLTHRILDSIKESIRNDIPTKRFGSAQEVYNTVEYLINTEYITGQVIKVNGGIYY